MADTPRTQLERAYRLIQEERLDEALGILRPMLDSDPNNADAWWLYANAVAEPSEARQALETVIRLNPKHAEARELLDQLKQAEPTADLGFGDLNLSDPFAGLRPDETSISTEELAGGMDLGDPFVKSPQASGNLLDEDAVPSFVGEGGTKPPRDFTVSDDEALLEALGTPSKPGAPQTRGSSKPSGKSGAPANKRPRNRVVYVLMGLLVILLIVLGGLLLAQKLATAPSGTTTGTALANLPTNQANVTAAATFLPGSGTAAVPTGNATGQAVASGTTNASQPGTAAATADPMTTAQQQTLAQFTSAGLTNPKAVVSTSSLGQTLTASFCSPFGPQLTNKLNQAMDTLAAQAATVSDQVQAISVEVYNCVNASQLELKAVASIQDVLAYVNKTMTVRQFRASWKSN